MTSPQSLRDLLTRVEEAEGPDSRLSSDLACELTGGAMILEPITASLDAALALVERFRPGIDAAQLLHESLEDMANGGWRDDAPLGPQICLYLLAALLRALLAQAEEVVK